MHAVLLPQSLLCPHYGIKLDCTYLHFCMRDQSDGEESALGERVWLLTQKIM